MAALVFVESAHGKIKKTSLEALLYARLIDERVVAVALGEVEEEELKSLNRYGAKKVLYAKNERLVQGTIEAYASCLLQAATQENTELLVVSSSLKTTPVAARVAVKMHASYASNVVDLPDMSKGFTVKQSIYTGKAFMTNVLLRDKKVIVIKKNAVPLKEVDANQAEIVTFNPSLSDADFGISVQSTERASGKMLLSDAEIVVSGGRGMKGSEHWGMLEELAATLGAATGCSKPVSDMGWRPHHEHVGQTGIKVAPQLYIAIGISGAIQHLAGVNSSKCIVVINKDKEAPFFKAANYGIVGDAFEIVPKLNQAIKELS